MDYYLNILLITGIYIILALSLNLINGLCGQFSLGHAGFWGIGAYCSAIFSFFYPMSLSPKIIMLLSFVIGEEHIKTSVEPLLNLLVAIIIGFLSASICGLIIGAACLRLKGDYLAIATLGFGEIIRITFMNMDLVGGPRGFNNIPKLANIYWVYFFVVLTVVFMINLKRSAFGRAIISIREDEIASENMGINLFGYKLFSFSIGAGIAGVAGTLFAHTQQFISPENFNFMASVVILVMIILGGLGSITGAIIGAIILFIVPELLKFLPQEIAQFRMLIYPVLLIILMLIKPSGIFGSYEWGERKRMKIKAAI